MTELYPSDINDRLFYCYISSPYIEIAEQFDVLS